MCVVALSIDRFKFHLNLLFFIGTFWIFIFIFFFCLIFNKREYFKTFKCFAFVHLQSNVVFGGIVRRATFAIVNIETA